MGIDDRSKVWYLQDGIKKDKLHSAKSIILSLAEYQKDFVWCVMLYKDFLQQWDDVLELKITDLKQADGGKKDNDTNDYDVDLWYNSYGEYQKLTPQQRRKLRRLREESKKLNKDKNREATKTSSSMASGGKETAKDETIAELKMKIATLDSMMKKYEKCGK